MLLRRIEEFEREAQEREGMEVGGEKEGGEWEKVTDPDSGEVFWMNGVTGEQRWAPPQF